MTVPCIVAFSTSTERGSVAVRAGSGEVCEVSYLDLHAHAERILSCLEEAMLRAGRSRNEIEAIATDVGPGSFTGVRVSIATAKGIAAALGKPIFGVCSLQAMAAQWAGESAGVLVPVIDARKGEWFVGAYRALGLAELAAPVHLPPAGLDTWRQSLRGDGSPLTTVGHPAGVDDPATAYPGAAGVMVVATQRYEAGERPQPADLDAIYVREPDAKLPTGLPRLEPNPTK